MNYVHLIEKYLILGNFQVYILIPSRKENSINYNKLYPNGLIMNYLILQLIDQVFPQLMGQAIYEYLIKLFSEKKYNIEDRMDYLFAIRNIDKKE